MDYAMKSLGLLSPASLSNMSASASMTQQLLAAKPPPHKPFRVTSADRSLKKGIMANELRDLICKVMDSLGVSCVSGLVLDEDGTGVDTEEFFQTLPENSVLMVLEKGQIIKNPSESFIQSSFQSWLYIDTSDQPRKDVAKITFDLYKNNPKDFIGCLSVKATLYGVYSVTYDLRCHAAKRMLKEALRWTLFSMQATGHVLLGSSFYMEQLLEEDEHAERRLLALPQASRVRHLQGLLLGKAL
uniref:CIDE-N domain-containing protein n=1 Tax=Gadus morhua TaxID=8049 RepID=A0A8C5FAK2_GADMO